MVRAHEWDGPRRLAGAPGSRRPWWVVAHTATPGFRVDWEQTGVHTVVAVRGDLGLVTPAHLEVMVAEQSLTGCAVLEVDLDGVPSIGSTGLSVLLEVRRWCLQRGMELRIRGAQPSVWRAFEVTGMDRVFAVGTADPAPRPGQELALF
jgi:anti-anti-sigma factor